MSRIILQFQYYYISSLKSDATSGSLSTVLLQLIIFSLGTRSHFKMDDHWLSSESRKIVISTSDIGHSITITLRALKWQVPLRNNNHMVHIPVLRNNFPWKLFSPSKRIFLIVSNKEYSSTPLLGIEYAPARGIYICYRSFYYFYSQRPWMTGALEE